MNDYIKREDAMTAVRYYTMQTGIDELPYTFARDEIYKLPAADVVEVRRGRWLRVGQSFIDPNKFLCFECSICRCTLDNHIKVEQNYCPNCGARMEGQK